MKIFQNVYLKYALCVVASLVFYSTHAQQQERPNILWITCEDISPLIGVYGDKIVKTPNIDQLAKEGVRYTHAYTTSGVCAPSRSSIITGMHQNSIGTQHMRTMFASTGLKDDKSPVYSAVTPDYVKCFPEYLRKAGYYCTNNLKQDYQFEAPVTVWDENSPAASFRNRAEGQPFFSVFNLFITHEMQLILRQREDLSVDPRKVVVPPYYPDTEAVRKDLARLYTNIEIMDKQVGELIGMLKEDGLYDNTIIFFYSDHGGALPWMKREILERGTHIPFIVRFPGGKGAGTINDDLISGVDFAPTVLSLAGVTIPKYMQGRAFLGEQKAKKKQKYVYAARDRMSEEHDRARMVRDKRYRYVYNYLPEQPFYQDINFRYRIPMMKEILKLRDAGKLDSVQMSWFKAKPLEELYDVQNDPYELHNLAADSKYKKKLIELRKAFQSWTKESGDMGGIPELEMVKQMWNGGDEPPITALPKVIRAAEGVKLSCSTKGASIGYRILKSNEVEKPKLHAVVCWDPGEDGSGTMEGITDKYIPAPPVWKIYDGEVIKLKKDETLHVNAMRIGYKPATLEYNNAGSVLK